jgi:hypothetical protein
MLPPPLISYVESIRKIIKDRDGTTHVIFEPLDFIARLAALVPKPRVNLTGLDEKHPYFSALGQP